MFSLIAEYLATLILFFLFLLSYSSFVIINSTSSLYNYLKAMRFPLPVPV